MITLLAVLFSIAHAIPTEGQKMMVAAPSRYAVETAEELIAQGGNVADVAVGVALTLSVTSPYYASLGGGGMAMVHLKDTTEALDFREEAPKALHPNTFANLPKEASMVGGLAIGVPGVPAGLWALHQKYGKLKWPQLFRRPLELAQKGFYVSGEWVDNTERARGKFNDSGKKLFFKAEQKSYGPRDRLVQKDLVQALKLYRDKNLKGFYQGPVAVDLTKSIKAAGGVMTLNDLEHYEARWHKPLTLGYKKYKVQMIPPPSSGGVILLTALRLAQSTKIDDTAPRSIDEYHLLAQILSRSFRGRTMLGDPQFIKNPLEMLLGQDYLTTLVQSISLDKVQPLEPLHEETTHFSVLDKNGDAISMTITLNGDYGSGVVSSKYGIALNNENNDFTTIPKTPNMFGLIQGQANLVDGFKRPLSSMTPTLVEKDGHVVASVGAPGGPRIVSCVFQVLHQLLDRGLNMEQAILAPRVHHQFLPNTLYYEAGRMTPETLVGLQAKGHQLEETHGVGRGFGVRLNDDGRLEAAFDSRGEGAAGGY